MLGSVVSDELFAPITCPNCDLQGQADVRLLVVACPACGEIIDLRPAPPQIVLERPELIVRDELAGILPRRHGWSVGAVLFLFGVALVFLGSGSNRSIASGAPFAVVGLALIGWWGARPPAAAPSEGRHGTHKTSLAGPKTVTPL